MVQNKEKERKIFKHINKILDGLELYMFNNNAEWSNLLVFTNQTVTTL